MLLGLSWLPMAMPAMAIPAAITRCQVRSALSGRCRSGGAAVLLVPTQQAGLTEFARQGLEKSGGLLRTAVAKPMESCDGLQKGLAA